MEVRHCCGLYGIKGRARYNKAPISMRETSLVHQKEALDTSDTYLHVLSLPCEVPPSQQAGPWRCGAAALVGRYKKKAGTKEG